MEEWESHPTLLSLWENLQVPRESDISKCVDPSRAPHFLPSLHTSSVDPPGTVPDLTYFQVSRQAYPKDPKVGLNEEKILFPHVCSMTRPWERLGRECQLGSEKPTNANM